MLEMRFVRENIELVKENLKKRNSDYNVDELLSFDVKRRELLQEVEVLKKERNDSSALIGKYKKEGTDTISRNKIENWKKENRGGIFL